ncbi:hypothetical protein [Flavobacterium sp.]|uniref:hypothetical protein n=1 Tax=Flavobacterium sp. TaxID=239 RepID=UPI0022C02E23|nr:hypothetical protein [Flavobacterium sp.]MCZ8089209.1 hypothetical protein [Flavobacterium sp.]
MAASHIRTIGAFVMWSLKGFKGSFKNQMNNNFILTFLVGVTTILIVFIGGIYLYGT